MTAVIRCFIAATLAVSGSLLIGNSHAQSSVPMETWGSARAMGMGGAFTAVARESEALFYNPAALARVSGFQWTILDPRIGASGQQALDVIGAVSDDRPFVEKLDDLYGKSVWLGGGAKTAFVLPYFGFAAFTHGDVGVGLQNPAFPLMNLNYVFDYGFALGGALDLVPGIWSVGITMKRVNRTGTTLPLGPAVLANLDMEMVKEQIKNRGTGYGLDVATMLTLPSPVRPTLAFTIRNAGYTAFSHEEGLHAPPRSEPDMTVGGSLSFDLPLLTITPAFDYKYADRTDIQVGKKIHFGVEVDLPLLSVRAGFNQGYYSLGAGFDLGVMSVEAATYGVELGEYPGQLEDRRYVVQASFQLGMSGLFSSRDPRGSSSGSSSNSSGRRKLKQRR
ncbi:MAG: hypothetical protein RBT63_03165 [Bdellovibrionales bacterium]|jgi:hypothetical protein|nr:hypothetical protein [Bdellovibrionales bacterium]